MEILRAAHIIGVALLACVGSVFLLGDLLNDAAPQWFLRVLNFVIIVGVTAGAGALIGEPSLDHDKCAQYVWLNEDWKCVPWEEAG